MRGESRPGRGDFLVGHPCGGLARPPPDSAPESGGGASLERLDRPNGLCILGDAWIGSGSLPLGQLMEDRSRMRTCLLAMSPAMNGDRVAYGILLRTKLALGFALHRFTCDTCLRSSSLVVLSLGLLYPVQPRRGALRRSDRQEQCPEGQGRKPEAYRLCEAKQFM